MKRQHFWSILPSVHIHSVLHIYKYDVKHHMFWSNEACVYSAERVNEEKRICRHCSVSYCHFEKQKKTFWCVFRSSFFGLSLLFSSFGFSRHEMIKVKAWQRCIPFGPNIMYFLRRSRSQMGPVLLKIMLINHMFHFKYDIWTFVCWTAYKFIYCLVLDQK